jgi:hypothetical protein
MLAKCREPLSRSVGFMHTGEHDWDAGHAFALHPQRPRKMGFEATEPTWGIEDRGAGMLAMCRAPLSRSVGTCAGEREGNVHGIEEMQRG